MTLKPKFGQFFKPEQPKITILTNFLPLKSKFWQSVYLKSGNIRPEQPKITISINFDLQLPKCWQKLTTKNNNHVYNWNWVKR